MSHEDKHKEPMALLADEVTGVAASVDSVSISIGDVETQLSAISGHLEELTGLFRRGVEALEKIVNEMEAKKR